MLYKIYISIQLGPTATILLVFKYIHLYINFHTNILELIRAFYFIIWI